MPFRYDRCQSHQLVLGHGVTADFAAHWNLRTGRLRWITMVREPIAWTLSNYKQRVASHTPGYEGITFDQCVQKGLCFWKYWDWLVDPVEAGVSLSALRD